MENVQTRYWSATPAHIKAAGKILRQGGLVAFPTETVYGIGANALCSKAIERIFQVKGRPSDNPLIVHVHNHAMVKEVVKELSLEAIRLMHAFWPGPLTLVLPKKPEVSTVISSGLDTIAVRMPYHEVALRLIEEAGVPIAAPSANISGRPSPTRAEHVWHDLAGKVECILDGGPSTIGVESTVLDCTTKSPVILRPGGVTWEALLQVIPTVRNNTEEEQPSIPRSPGMKYSHYSPRAEVVLLQGEDNFALRHLLQREIAGASGRIGVIGVEEIVWDIRADMVQIAGSIQDLSMLAESLYDFFRRCDEAAIDRIFVHSVPARGLGRAVMNRLLKAADITKTTEEV